MDQPPTEPPPKRPGLSPILLGALLALAAGALIAWFLTRGGNAPSAPPPASQAGLVIDSSAADDGIDPTRPLRCFVEGQFVGELTLTDCARRNGVATDALDVGLDETGALAAADQGLLLTPLPPAETAEAPVEEAPFEAEPPPPAVGPVATCWRHSSGQWRRLPADMGLNACVQTLFSGRCERPGQAAYGRWGQQTLRLVTGRVEISPDNQSFRTLTTQGPGCSLAPVAAP